METFIAQCVNGISTGSMYALIVLGMNLVVLVRGVMLFCYAHIVAMTMAIGWLVLELTGNNLFITIPAMIISSTILLTAAEPLFRPMARRKAFLETVVLALGIGIILTEIMSHFINQGAPFSLSPLVIGKGLMFRYNHIIFSLTNILSLIGCVLAITALMVFLYRHKQGRAIRAMALDLEIATMMGIPFKKTGLQGFAIAGVLAGVTSILLAMNLGWASAELGDALAAKCMILLLFAGVGNLKGGLICSLAMGVAEAMALAYLPGRWTEAVFFGTIMVIIILKPKGLFGTQS